MPGGFGRRLSRARPLVLVLVVDIGVATVAPLAFVRLVQGCAAQLGPPLRTFAAVLQVEMKRALQATHNNDTFLCHRKESFTPGVQRVPSHGKVADEGSRQAQVRGGGVRRPACQAYGSSEGQRGLEKKKHLKKKCNGIASKRPRGPWRTATRSGTSAQQLVW